MRSADNIWIGTKNSDFSFTEVDQNEIILDDILTSLPQLRRFLGYTQAPWSVAQHTLLCVKICEVLGYSDRVTQYTLLHDFHEAYTGDIPGPLHWLLKREGVTIIKDLQKKIDAQIRKHFGLDEPTEEELHQVKQVDITALNIEAFMLLGDPDWVDHEWFPADEKTFWEIKEMLYSLRYMSESGIRDFLARVINSILVKQDVA